MMKIKIRCAWVVQALALTCAMADDFSFDALEEDTRSRLNSGEPVVLDRRPDESEDADKRFVTVAQFLTGSRAEIWDVIADKEGAEHFLSGVLASDVISEGDGFIVVEQETAVGGPKGSYRYVLRHELTPMKQIEFSFVEGEIKNVEGAWWIYDSPVDGKHIVVYALHVDPGGFAPQIIVKSGMKKSIPGTFASVQKEVLKRRAAEDSARNRFRPSRIVTKQR